MANWTDPKYPGDTILIQNFTKGEEIGCVRVQWYTNRSLKVGAFLPGVEQCPPGDTPKTFPEKSVTRGGKGAAMRTFQIYCRDALGAGWKVLS